MALPVEIGKEEQPPSSSRGTHASYRSYGPRGVRRGRGGGRGSRGITASFQSRPAATASSITEPRSDVQIQAPPAVQRNDAAESIADRAEQDGEVEAEVCFICASPVVHQSIAPCNHRTCHICGLRMRALYKNRGCAHCRVCYAPI